METAVQNSVDRVKGDTSASLPSESTLLGGVLALTALVYAATVRFDFVYDDQNQIVRNTLVQSWRFVPGYFKGHQWLTLFPNASANYYRPMNFLWFRVNDALFGTLTRDEFRLLSQLLGRLAAASAPAVTLASYVEASLTQERLRSASGAKKTEPRPRSGRRG